MTREQIDQMRKNAIIEGELKIIESIPFYDFSGVTHPHLLGRDIVDECIENIRKALA